MIHDTFGTVDLEKVNVWLFEAGWDYVQGNIYVKQVSGGEIKGRLELCDNYYAMRAI